MNQHTFETNDVGASSQVEFNKLLLNSFDQALTSLGQATAASIYFYLEDHFKIKKMEIPKRINDSLNALEKLFGVGADYLEIFIMKNLYAETKFFCARSKPAKMLQDMTFSDFVSLMEKIFRENFEKEIHVEIILDEEQKSVLQCPRVADVYSEASMDSKQNRRPKQNQIPTKYKANEG